MSTLVSTRIKGPLLKEVEQIAAATDLGMADLARLGLKRVVREYKETGGLRLLEPAPSTQKKGGRK